MLPFLKFPKVASGFTIFAGFFGQRFQNSFFRQTIFYRVLLIFPKNEDLSFNLFIVNPSLHISFEETLHYKALYSQCFNSATLAFSTSKASLI